MEPSKLQLRSFAILNTYLFRAVVLTILSYLRVPAGPSQACQWSTRDTRALSTRHSRS